MTTDEVLQIIAEHAARMTPSRPDANPLARAGKTLGAEIARLRLRLEMAEKDHRTTTGVYLDTARERDAEITRLRALATVTKCSERLPEKIGNYLIKARTHSEWHKGHWDGERWSDFVFGGRSYFATDTVTHWLELPLDPETSDD